MVSDLEYIKNDIDLTPYALQFVYDEISFYDIIQSYTSEQKVALFICINGLVSSGAYYEANGGLVEYFRYEELSDKQFLTIKDWYAHFNNGQTTVDKVLNNVFIGEDLVPLWKVLEDSLGMDIAADEDLLCENSEVVETHFCQYVILTLFFSYFVGLFALIVSIYF